MQGEQLMDLDGYEKGYAHGWRDGRAEPPDPGEARAEALRRVEALIVKELPCNLLGCERMGTHIDEDETPLWYCEDHRSPPWAPGREFPPDPSRIAILAVIREET